MTIMIFAIAESDLNLDTHSYHNLPFSARRDYKLPEYDQLYDVSLKLNIRFVRQFAVVN